MKYTSESKLITLDLPSQLLKVYLYSYFDNEDPQIVVNFSKAFKQLDHGEVIILDHLGKFLNFFIGCIDIAEEKLLDEGFVQIANYRKIIEKLITKIEGVTLEQLDVHTFLDVKTSSTLSQFLNILEALMLYCCHDLSTNVNVERIGMLFKKHQKVTTDALKLQENCKKLTKKGKNQTADLVAPKVELDLNCVWDLKALGNFLTIIFEDDPNEKVNELRQNENFVRFILNSTSKRIFQLTSAPDYLKMKHSKAVFSALKKYSAIFYRQMDREKFQNLYERFDAESAVALSDAFKNALMTMDVVFKTPAKWQDFLQKVTNTQNTADWMINEVIKTVQKNIEWAFEEESDVHLDPNGEQIVVNLFTTLEILFKNFQKMSSEYTRDAFNWLLDFCKKTEINQKNLQIVNRILFLFMARQDESNILMQHIAHKMSSIYGHLEDLQGLKDFPQHDLKSITIATVDQSFFYFASLLKKQIEHVEFCILRMNSYNAHIKIPGQDSRNESINALLSLEKSCVVHLTHLGKVFGRLCNSRLNTRGSQIETIGKVVISYFVCLGNLIKHFSQHYNVKNLDFQSIPLELLMKETKIAVKSIYALAPYIEDTLEEEQKKAERENKKKSASKEFKYMSRLVYNVEKFAEKIQKLDQLTKKNFRKYLHTGDVRDFRIKEREVREQEESESSENETMETSDVEDDDDGATEQKRQRQKRVITSSDEEELVDSDETNASFEPPRPIQRDGFIKNLKKMAEKNRRNASKR